MASQPLAGSSWSHIGRIDSGTGDRHRHVLEHYPYRLGVGRERTLMSGETARYERGSPGPSGDDFPALRAFRAPTVSRGPPAYVTLVDVWWTPRAVLGGSVLDVLLARFRRQGSCDVGLQGLA